jgi:polysaccharide biosynthesis/export protein VpsN
MTRRQALAALVVLSAGFDSKVIAQEPARFFVIGAVARPGSFNYEENITVRQAIAMAGGLNQYGSARRIRIRRQVDGKTVENDVTMTDIVQPNDTVTVPRRFY